MQKIKKILIIARLTIILNIGFSQIKNDTVWTKFTIVNKTAFPVYNIILHYNKGADSTWAVSFMNRYDRYLQPNDSTSEEVNNTISYINYYTYNYTFKGSSFQKSINAKFLVNPRESNIILLENFYLPQPWWRSWWFYTFCICLLLVIIWSIYKYYAFIKIKLQNRKLEKELAIQNERMRISTEMHDDIGAGLYGINLQTELLKSKVTDPEVFDSLKNIHASIGQISNKVKEVIWSFNADNDNLINVISFIHQQAHRMFENSQTKFTLTSAINLPQVNISGDKRRHIYLIVREALNNIIKHSEATSAEIQFTHEEDHLKILILDNGKGFTDDLKSVNQVGLRSIKNRVAKIAGKLTITSSNQGTRLEILVPVLNEK